MKLRDISKLKLFAWDELGNELNEMQPADLFATNAEGGWLSAGWTEDFKVEIRTTDRHKACEGWFETWEEAHEAFQQVEEYRQACQADNEANG